MRNRGNGKRAPLTVCSNAEYNPIDGGDDETSMTENPDQTMEIDSDTIDTDNGDQSGGSGAGPGPSSNHTHQTPDGESEHHSHEHRLTKSGEHGYESPARKVRSRSVHSDHAVGQGSTRPRSRSSRSRENAVFVLEAENSNEFNLIEAAENELEARKIFNNYQFGLRIWKSHVTSRPIATRSEIVQELYSDLKKPLPVDVSTVRVSNILYSVLIGWWLALLYCIIGCLMYATFIGRNYGSMCFRLAGYFMWPFGKFVNQYHNRPLYSVATTMNARGRFTPVHADSHDNQAVTVTMSKEMIGRAVSPDPTDPGSLEENEEAKPLLEDGTHLEQPTSFWAKPATYVWLVLGVPFLVIAHGLIVILTWFMVVTIPISKINMKTISKILFTPPDDIAVGSSGQGTMSDKDRHSEIIMYTHQSFNFYYYKYTVDGVNVILANLLVFVIICIVVGYADEEDEISTPITKCILGILAILPVTYYIGMAITSISAQSSFAVGAIMNATFGSMVEVILFILMLKKGKEARETCYMELVKSTLTGSILCCILLVPGLSMVLGGLKYRRQKFNPRSANISSSLLFVAIMGVFAPTIFSKIYGNLECEQCVTLFHPNSTFPNETGFLCSGCTTVTIAPNDDKSLYKAHIEPLLYTCAIILPLSYIIGLIFFMKTHSTDIFEEFERTQRAEGAGAHHGNAQWSRLKSAIILLLSVTAIALCADMIANNIAPLLEASGMSEYFVGVTLLSVVSMLPEVVNGVQFALQNNVNLGIEIGSAAAIQVCMVQLPIIVLADLIYPLGFGAVFNDIHLWAVIFAVIIINYVFQDGKSDYFQGSIVMFIYILLMAMYFFTVTPEAAICKKA